MKNFISLALFFIILTSGLAGYSQDFIVDNAGDASDMNPGDGICSSSPLAVICSLRAAIEEANAIAGPNIISFGLASGTQINIDSELEITDNETTINADLGGDGKPDIIIASTAAGSNGFHIRSADNVIQGFNLILFTNGAGGPAAILIDGAAATANKIITNYIGTNLAGDNTTAATTNFRSLRIINGASGNFIGDASIIGRNVISGNTFGLEINASDNNQVIGNIFGLDATGSIDLGNGDLGIEIINSVGTIIGSPADGRNFISGNNSSGIEINNSASTSVINNFIGVNAAGNAGVGNSADGITITGNSTGTTIGDGAATGGNLISGNSNQALEIGSSGVNVLGNIVGLDVSGTAAIPNTSIAIWVRAGATGITIGNGTADGRNIVSGNTGHGIQLSDGSNTVQGNYVGLGTDGDQLLGNSGIGVFVTAGADNEIGGVLAGEGNVISGNSAAIQIGAGAHFVYGNTIGLDATRAFVRANNEGIRLTGTAKGVLIGDVTVAGANFISGNTTDGIYIDGANVNTNTIQNNYIGVLGDLTSPAGNGANGIAISGDANLNTINNNVISNSGTNGIEVNGAFAPLTMNNTFSQNSIFNNTNKGISIVAGAQGNVLPPVINTIDANVSGTSGLFADIEVFLDAGAQGEFYVGITTADDAGLWNIPIDRGTFPAGLDNMTAIQTSLGNSSEFSAAFLLPPPLPFITTWQSDNPGTSNNTQITIPTFGAGYSYDIYWEEVGVPTNNGTEPTQIGNHTITFPSVGTYLIEISGNFPQIYFANSGDKDKILSVEQWGEIAWATMAQAFYGCTNLIVPAVDAPDLSGVTSLFYMFRGATSLNHSIDHWDVSTILNFGHMFRDATSFNQSFSSWDVSNAQKTFDMFSGAIAFNQDIGTWNVSNVNDMSGMFFNATSFNQDISGWNVGLVGDFDSMFGGATSFNQDIGNWDVSSGWMFWSMFENATAFDQNLGSWDVSNADYLDDMLNNTALSVANYDAALIGWESLPTLISSINLGAAGLFYCSGEAARTSLETTHGWTITDAGLDCTAGCADPPMVNAGADAIWCSNDSRNINGLFWGGANSVTWTTNGDGTFSDNTSVFTNYTLGVNDIANGSVTLTLTTDDPDGTGPCLAAADDMIITIEAAHTVVVGPDQTVCQGDPVNLTGTIGGSALTFYWTIQGVGDGSFDNANSLTAIYTPGSADIANGSVNLELWTDPTTCEEEFDAILITISNPISVVDQTASLNVTETTIIDVTNGATLNSGDVIATTLLTQPQKGTTIINGDGSISYTALAGTVGDDTFDYEIRNQCNLFSSAQIIITIINVPPVVDVPPSTIIVGGIVTRNILADITDDNDNIDPSTLKILVQPISGATASLDASGNLTVDYAGLKFIGTDQLTIEICDLDGLCTSQVIFIEVEPPGVTVYNAVSPNGDSKHDFLEIENAEFFSNNQVKIMNRWGDLVFEIAGYDNDTKKFIGVANKNGSGELPSGTYYYNIVLGDGSKDLTGFFTLRR